MRLSIDTSQVADLAADMAGAGARVTPKVRAVMSKGALNVKADMQNEVRAFSTGHPGRFHERFAADISYEFVGRFKVDIGATTNDDIGSAQFMYYGNSKTGPLAPDPIRSMRKEAKPLARYVLDAGAESVW